MSSQSAGVDPAVRRAMLANRSRDTAPELRVRSALHRRGLRFRVCRRPIPEVRRSADVVFPRAKVAVFVDGCFWHRCPEHYRQPGSNVSYWVPKVDRTVNRDLATDRMLAEAGWVVIRCWEHEAVDDVADRIEAAVRGSTPAPSP